MTIYRNGNVNKLGDVEESPRGSFLLSLTIAPEVERLDHHGITSSGEVCGTIGRATPLSFVCCLVHFHRPLKIRGRVKVVL